MLEIADQRTEMQVEARCWCGARATNNARLVNDKVVFEGETVVVGLQNQPGTTLMTVSDLNQIDAEVKVAEADVLRLALGQAATVTLEAVPGKRFDGKVVEIGASALPTTGTGEYALALLGEPNVYGTHHIGASTEQAQEAIAAETVRIVRSFAEVFTDRITETNLR